MFHSGMRNDFDLDTEKEELKIFPSVSVLLMRFGNLEKAQHNFIQHFQII